MTPQEMLAYRKAAERLSGGTTQEYTTIQQPASKDGAFVEVMVWVPKAEMEQDYRREER